MELVIVFFFIVVLLLFVSLKVYMVFGFLESVFMLFTHRPFVVHLYGFTRRLPLQEQQYLRQYFSFYKHLSPRYQRYFEHRVERFIRHYKWLPRDGFVLSRNAQLLIAATAVELTFGLRKYLMKSFETIVIYPSAYTSVNTGALHKGEFNPGAKAIVFSWEDFYKGLQHTSDNLNLGLHEFAHALQFHGLKSNDASAMVFSEQYKKMIQYFDTEEVRNGLMKTDFFRDYAFSNRVEFFAVVLEHFFESPEEFKQRFPTLYSKVSRMLNSNPARRR